MIAYWLERFRPRRSCRRRCCWRSWRPGPGPTTSAVSLLGCVVGAPSLSCCWRSFACGTTSRIATAIAASTPSASWCAANARAVRRDRGRARHRQRVAVVEPGWSVVRAEAARAVRRRRRVLSSCAHITATAAAPPCCSRNIRRSCWCWPPPRRITLRWRSAIAGDLRQRVSRSKSGTTPSGPLRSHATHDRSHRASRRPFFEPVPCYHCGSGDREPFISAAGRPDRQARHVHVRHLPGCGLRYQNPRVTLDHIGEYYDDDYIAHRKKRNWGLLTPLVEHGMNKLDADKDRIVVALRLARRAQRGARRRLRRRHVPAAHPPAVRLDGRRARLQGPVEPSVARRRRVPPRPLLRGAARRPSGSIS